MLSPRVGPVAVELLFRARNALPLARFRGALALVGKPFAFVGTDLAFIREPVTLVGDAVALLGGPIAASSQPLARLDCVLAGLGGRLPIGQLTPLPLDLLALRAAFGSLRGVASHTQRVFGAQPLTTRRGLRCQASNLGSPEGLKPIEADPRRLT